IARHILSSPWLLRDRCAGENGLAERKSAIARRQFAREQRLHALLAQPARKPLREHGVHEAAAAQRDALLAQPPRRIEDPDRERLDQRSMKKLRAFGRRKPVE